jgi:prepilin-type N-terminal cleavage/methylation domain-containing protein
MSSSKRAYTLVELLISLSLLAVLFTLLGSLLMGMSRISRLAEDDSLRERELNFCISLIRKELGEMQVDQKLVDYNFLGGDNFIAYTTTRRELLARDSIPGGSKRVEWRYDPTEKILIRTVSQLIDGKRQIAAAPVKTKFLEGLAGFESYFFDGVNWLRITGISELMPRTGSLALRFVFDDPDEPENQKFYESAFILPNETFAQKK